MRACVRGASLRGARVWGGGKGSWLNSLHLIVEEFEMELSGVAEKFWKELSGRSSLGVGKGG